MTSLDKSVESSKKSVPLKPSSLILKIQMDFQIAFGDKEKNVIPLEQRYSYLLESYQNSKVNQVSFT